VAWLVQMRELRQVGTKMAYVLVPRRNRNLLRDCMFAGVGNPCTLACMAERCNFLGEGWSHSTRGFVGSACALPPTRCVRSADRADGLCIRRC